MVIRLKIIRLKIIRLINNPPNFRKLVLKVYKVYCSWNFNFYIIRQLWFQFSQSTPENSIVLKI
jgi:hypothetical protein